MDKRTAKRHGACRGMLAFMLSIVLACGLVPAPALAEAANELDNLVIVDQLGEGDAAGDTVLDLGNGIGAEVVQEVSETVVGGAGGASNDELLASYIEQQFNEQLPESGDMSVQIQSAGDYLTGNDKKAFEYLKDQIALIASGEQHDTQIEIPLSVFTDRTTFTWAEVGISQPKVNGTLTDEAMAAANSVITIDYSKVVHALLVDCPFDLYWFDKTTGYSYTTSYALSYTSTSFTLTSNPHVSFKVSSDYGSDYMVSSNVGTIVDNAVAEAIEIANDHKDEPASERLRSYKDAICGKVDYNWSAVEDVNTSYGDPWQLVWVFDNDPATKVVCEGYSKAFKYLCDLSGKSDVECILATGGMGSSGSELGNHMWNVVHMPDNKNYLVDVTNCDSWLDDDLKVHYSVGYSYILFLAPYYQGSFAGGYAFTASSKTGVEWYVYDSDTKATFSVADLTISDTAYDPANDVGSKQAISPVVSIEGWTYGAAASTPTLAQGSNPGNGAVVFEYKVQGADDNTYAESVPTEAGDYTVRATIAETDGYLGGSAVADFTIAKATPSLGTVTASGASCDLDASKVVLSRTDESVAGTLALDAAELQHGKGDYGWTFSPQDATNYNIVTGMVEITVPDHQPSPATNQNVVAPTCVDAGSHDEVTSCTACGAELSREHRTDAALGHDYATTVVAPTWDDAGYTLHKCSRCDDEYRTDQVASLHDQALAVAQPVINAIDALPSADTLTLDDEDAVLAARGAYSALTEQQRELVGNYGKLESVEARLAELRAEAARVDLSSATVSAPNQTYSGKVLTPTVMVTLNGTKLAVSDYDVKYTNNTNAGTATITVTGRGNYKGTATGTFTIARKAVTVKADNKSKTYGQADPKFTATVSGTVGTDKVTYTLSRAAGSNAGTYAITAKGAATQGNYAVAFKAGTLTIQKAAQTITASDKTVAMGKTTSIDAKASGGGALSYKTSDAKVATVNASGVVTPVKVGTVTITITAAATTNHSAATTTITVIVAKGAQPMVVTVATKSVKASVVKKKAAAVAPITVKNAQGKVTYARVSKGSSAALTVNKKSGKVTVKKGTKKGTYKIKVTVTAAGNGNWKKGSKTVTCTVKVK